MSDPVIELSQQAQTLALHDRARLAELILESIHPASRLDVENAWDEELHRRIREIDSGDAKLIPAEEVFAQVRRALR